LFRGATQNLQHHALPPTSEATTPAPAPVLPLVLGIDEYESHGYTLDRTTRGVRFFRLADWTEVLTVPLPTLATATPTCAYRLPVRDGLIIGLEDGQVLVAEARFGVDYTVDARSITPSAREIATVRVFAEGDPVARVHGRQTNDGGYVFVAIAQSGAIASVRVPEGEPAEVRTLPGTLTNVVAAALDHEGNKLFIATADGKLHQWYLEDHGDAPFRVYSVLSHITAMDLVIGDNSVLLGFADGRVEQWAGVREHPTDFLRPFYAINTFANLPAAVTAIQPSGRDKGFLAGAADGTVHLDFTTSRRTLLESATGSAVRLLAYAPKLTSYLAGGADGRVWYAAVNNPHPEVSLRVLFGKVHYEGYDEPDYVWQSTGGTDDAESKLSLVPLVFGTMKAAFFGLLFALPIAVAAALYTSQFMPPGLRAVVKPTVEVMAALPSVVIGFLAGLWLAPLLETRLVGVLLIPVVAPLVVTLAALVWHQLPRSARQWVAPGWDIILLVPVVAGAIWFCQVIAPAAESAFFAGDFRQWVFNSFGHQIEQRNSIVIGVALGFAVIPIIFTISEDAFSNVPASFRSASFALGASPWQTAWRVIMPTASPGVFSATMIGFGRAVGETMIVLMCFGNTPIMSMSPFNGGRPLAANIAVEIPEAPAGGTLYRVLFVTALLLFAITFCVNTVAEIVRQRLRQRYQAV
jgi:phosphate transport system permease protein